MANEAASGAAAAGDGNLESVTATTNEPRRALSHALPSPANDDIWGKIRQNLELAAKLLPLVWSAFLVAGGLNFLVYYGSIQFIPELDLKASITVLAASASVGTMLLVSLSIILLGPALAWRGTVKNKTLKSFWYKDDTELLRLSAILWFIGPLIVLSIFIVLTISLGWAESGTPFDVASLLLFITIPAFMGCLIWRRLPNHVNVNDKWRATITVVSNTLYSTVMLYILLYL